MNEVFVVGGVSASNGIEVTSNDPDYEPSESDVGSEMESDDSTTDASIDDSADDGGHEDYFESDYMQIVERGFFESTKSTRCDKSDDDCEISDGYQSCSLHSMEGGSDGDESTSKYLSYNPAEMHMDYKWRLGLEFSSINEFKEAMKEWTLLNGRDIRYVKNDKVRCRVKCVGEGCEWMAFVSKVGNTSTYKLKTYKGEHTCGRTFNGHLASSNWVANKLSSTMKLDEKKKLSHVIQDVKKNYMADVSIHKAYWGRRKAIRKLEGEFVEQYGRIWDYCEEVRQKNPMSTLKVQLDRPSLTHEPHFQRLYMCIGAVKTGFVNGCRPIIGLDGCHLKGQYGQQLLVAVGVDPNDNYFPIAVAAVEAETKDSWGWFISLLLADLGSQTTRNWVWITDQQKGLQFVIEEMLPGAEHRYCLRHLYANCRRQFGGGTALRNLLMSIAKATYVQDWERKMKQLQTLNKDCYEKMHGLNPAQWTRSHFRFHSKCDMLMNNVSESFNGRILEARDKPILTMLEWIRGYWMDRFFEKRTKGEKYKGKILPKPKKRLDGEVINSRNWTSKWAGELKFEVAHSHRHISEKFVVDLQSGSCTCRFWGLTGLPCQHACSAIFLKGDNPENYISNYYTPEAYMRCYRPVVEPVPGENAWPTMDMVKILPPQFRAKPGRPKRLRRREVDENPSHSRYKRTGAIIKCSRCKEVGHNKATCKLPPPEPTTPPPPTVGATTVVPPLGLVAVAPIPVAQPTQFGTSTAQAVTGGRGRGRGRTGEKGKGRSVQAVTALVATAVAAGPSIAQAVTTPASVFGTRGRGRPKLPTRKPNVVETINVSQLPPDNQ